VDREAGLASPPPQDMASPESYDYNKYRKRTASHGKRNEYHSPKVPPSAEPPVRTMPMEKARKLIRKTSAEHAGLFRRLAK
jgi:hypothetical protein